MQKLSELTKDKLISLYINDKKSLEDIAGLYKVSRVAIYKRLKKYGHRNSFRLFNILYKNAQNELFLERKYNRFLEGLRGL